MFRPATIDLILTKMARADEDDLQDIDFLMRVGSVTSEELEKALAQARIPDLLEIQELFSRAKPKVLALLQR